MSSRVYVLATHTTIKATEVAELYFCEIVHLHGLPESIVSDQDSKFTSKFWQELHHITGGRLLMSTAFHPETDGTSERAIRSVNQVLHALIDVSQDNWHSKLPAIEFAMNSSISNSMSYAPFEINYGWMPTMINGLTQDTKFKGVKHFAMQAIWNMEKDHDALITSRVYQMHQANKHWRSGPEIVKGSKVYLSTTNLFLPSGCVCKFLPKYIGSYTVIDV